MTLLLRTTSLVVLLALTSGAFAQDALQAPRAYPNPLAADQALIVELPDAASATAEVYDVLGRRVSLNGPLAAGTYLVRALYADGRVTEPVRFTTLSPGQIEIRLVEAADSPLAPEAALEAPVVEASNGIAGCSGDVAFAGFYHTALVGALRIRTDLQPQSMRAKTAGNNVEFVSCFGGVQGVSYRYIAGGEFWNRPLRVLSPAVVGNTSVTYTVNYTDGTANKQAVYGTFEQQIDNDGDVNTATVPAVGLTFDTDSSSPVVTKGGGASYELIVLDDQVVVYRGLVSEFTPLFFTPTGGATRVNLLRSLLLSSAVEGYEIEGGTKPGDISGAFTFESNTGADVNVHVGEGAPIASGNSIHVTPVEAGLADPAAFRIFDVRTSALNVEGFGTRAIRFAAGAETGEIGTAQWAGLFGEFTEPQLFTVMDPSAPYVFVDRGGNGVIPDYGIQWGREPMPLQESGSEEIDVEHADGYVVDEAGEFYRSISSVRNESEKQTETITVQIENVGRQTAVTVTNQEGSFSTYDFIFQSSEGTFQRNYAVGSTNTFSNDGVTVFYTGAVDIEGFAASATQDYFNGFVVELGNGVMGTLYIVPNWDTPFADIEVRYYATETDRPYTVSRVEQYNDIPNQLQGNVKERKTRRWVAPTQ